MMEKANEKGFCEEGGKWLASRTQKEIKGLDGSVDMIRSPS